MFFEGIWIIILGTIASVMVTVGWIPQIIRGYKTKSLSDVSYYLMILISTGSVLWIFYGVEINDKIIVGVNIAILIFNLTLLGMKIKYSRK
ncbi:SemiSWEET family transporter [Candidatus Nitrosotenuis chungbukensis]|uniref:SemiSWEET family sugar transporter n=1 Tax=Candidatus Nitrosotenuis chungbukensis TaxID=1353246 RepID=UPI0005B292D0|nr:SemiSWEET family transporter [Candidatus Nitrosotenuis chungbukensis]WKT57574.1 SemiSWEET family transporter [Candidatus Nitrosotenuis chungbukensis]